VFPLSWLLLLAQAIRGGQWGSESWVLGGNLDGVSIVFVDLSQQGRGLMKVGLKASRLLHGLLLKLSQFLGEEKGYKEAIYMWSLLKLFSKFIFKNISFLIWFNGY